MIDSSSSVFFKKMAELAHSMSASRPKTPVLLTPQMVRVQLEGSNASAINLCSNDYLGYANHPELKQVACDAIDSHGLGMASVRFICGTQDLHRELERRIARYLGKADAILFGSCFDANAALFEALFDENDAIVSDSLNHASIIDGIRLSKARRFRYANGNIAELNQILSKARSEGAATIAVVSDGVFSMDGVIADINALAECAERHGAILIIDDSHAVGVLGPQGRGTQALCSETQRVHLMTGTFGKALGGAMGGYIAGPAEVIEVLRLKARPYLFSNSLPPAIVAASIAAINLAEADDAGRKRISASANKLRSGLQKMGYRLGGAGHAIIPVMLGEDESARNVERLLRSRDILARSFTFPVVPKGAARVRCQISAAHSDDDIDQVLGAFEFAAGKIQKVAAV